jgi:nucleotide-binding universal stress UspA family protein
MYSKVIVPLDGSELSEQSLPYAELIARSLGASIELVQAYDVLPAGLLGARNRQGVVDRLDQGARDRALASMESQRQRLEGDGHNVSLVAQRGPAADVIVAAAGAEPTALVVMSTHGRSGISRWVMGSVTDKVLHTTPNPMLIVRANVMGPASPETSLKTVVVPLDGSPLSELAIPHAISVAGALSSGITVLRITPTENHYRHQINLVTPEMGTVPDFDMAEPGELVSEDADEASGYLADVRNRMRIDHAHGVASEHRVNDNIAQTIIERAGEQPSLVAMTTHGRSGVGRMVLGSVTDRVVRHSNLPVLVIR